MIILISGATGTLGTELFTQLINIHSKKESKITRFILLGRNRNKLLNLQRISISNKIPCTFLEIDFSNVESIFYNLNKLTDIPDYLYLFHGYLKQSEEIDIKESQKHLNINYLSIVEILNYYLQKSDNLKVILTSSLAAKLPSPTMSFYAASKSALNSFIDAKRLEYRNKNLTVLNCILGLIDNTNMTENIQKFKGVQSYDPKQIIKTILEYSIKDFRNETINIGNFVQLANVLNYLSPSMMNVISKWSMPKL